MHNSLYKQQFQQLVQRFEPQSKLLGIQMLKEGMLGTVTVLDVEQPEGHKHKLVVRQHGERERQSNPQIAADEFRLLQQLCAAGVATSTPYYLDESCEIFATPYLVVEYIDGTPEYEPANGAKGVAQIATQLAAIHRLDGANADLGLPVLQTDSFDKRLGAALASGVDVDTIRQQLASKWPLPQRNRLALLHGDFWPGNLLWKAGQLVAVIDWEDAKLGDPLEDLAISRFDICFIYGVEALREFTALYRALSPIDFTHLPYWDLYAALRAAPGIAEWAAGWAELGRPDLTAEKIANAHGWFVQQALAALENDTENYNRFGK